MFFEFLEVCLDIFLILKFIKYDEMNNEPPAQAMASNLIPSSSSACMLSDAYPDSLVSRPKLIYIHRSTLIPSSN